MIATKGYAVHIKTDQLPPFNFYGRKVGPHDVLIKRVIKNDGKYLFGIRMATSTNQANYCD